MAPRCAVILKDLVIQKTRILNLILNDPLGASQQRCPPGPTVLTSLFCLGNGEKISNVGANPPGGLQLRGTSTGRKYLLWNDLTLNPSLGNSDGIRPGDLLMLFQPLEKA